MAMLNNQRVSIKQLLTTVINNIYWYQTKSYPGIIDEMGIKRLLTT